MKYSVEVKKDVYKFLSKIDKKTCSKIYKSILSLSENPRPLNSKKIVGTKDVYRIRVGDYRVIYNIDDGKLRVFVIKADHRKDIYEFL